MLYVAFPAAVLGSHWAEPGNRIKILYCDIKINFSLWATFFSGMEIRVVSNFITRLVSKNLIIYFRACVWFVWLMAGKFTVSLKWVMNSSRLRYQVRIPVEDRMIRLINFLQTLPPTCLICIIYSGRIICHLLLLIFSSWLTQLVTKKYDHWLKQMSASVRVPMFHNVLQTICRAIKWTLYVVRPHVLLVQLI